MKRRNFLKTGAATTMVPFALNGYGFKAHGTTPLLSMLAKRMEATDRVLVVIQLDGGNDGLNTVIPLDQYSKLSTARSNILIQQSKVLSLNGTTTTGLNPAMTHLQGMYNNGLVNIVQAVGVQNPNFSHFRATDIWMSASDSNEYVYSGWLGRYLDSRFPGYPTGYPNGTMPDPLALQIGSYVTLALQGPNNSMGMAISDPAAFYQLASGTVDPAPSTPAGKELTYVRVVAQQSNAYGTVVKNAATAGKNLSTKYPAAKSNSLADQLKIVAQLISGGLKTPIYMVRLGGFDNHSAQVDASDTTHATGTHATLLKKVSEAIEAFQDDLKLLGVQDRVAGMTFSEFGRRIASNASVGTDHGAAAPLFVFGTGVQSGIIGSSPTIPTSVSPNDNVPLQYDFRLIYASVLKDWFGLSTAEVKAALNNKDFNTLPIFKSAPSSIADWADTFAKLELFDNFPNPANGETIISFYTDGGNIQLQMFDALGKMIKILAQGKHRGGKHEIKLNVGGWKPGNYYYQLSQGDKRITKTMVVI